MKQEVASFLNYAAASPTVFQATQQACDMLEAAGFTRLSEQAAWNIVPGGRYFVTRNRSAVVAFAVPENGLTHCQIVASHGDSPTFKLKAHAEGEAADAYIRLNVERYGGMIMSTWFDKPLSIAGRALVRENGRLTTKLVDLERDAALIPNMPIHFNRDINNGYSYNPQVDMLPLFGDKDAKGALGAEIAAKAGVPEADVVACDLFLYNRTPASVWGAHEEFFSCPRIDDLECAYTSLAAFIAAPAAGHVNVCAVFDNEEVGSLSKQGADSTLLGDVLNRALASLGGHADSRGAGLQLHGFGGQRARRSPEPSGKIRRAEPHIHERRRGHQAQRQPEIHHRRGFRRDFCGNLRQGRRARAAFRQPFGCSRRLDAGQSCQRAYLDEHRGYRSGSAGHALQL